ncbi:MAG: hypothetical protein AMXMBFR56_16160 [Polyangiaceae bacterium]
MAVCAACDQRTSYPRFWRSTFGNFRRNMTERPKISPLITCPHCGADNAQRMSYALAQVVGIAAVVVLSFVAVAPVFGTNPMLLVGLAL